MSATGDVVITGIGIEVPGLPAIEDLLSQHVFLAPAEFDPVAKLGRKGLLYKDQATKLALCAVQEALTCAGLSFQNPEQSSTTGVVVSSNLGNVDTVCRLVETIHKGSVEDLSPLELPNASSNVIASTIAIRFGCRGVNLMLCNGATSGIDALYTAANLIRAGRVHRMLVVGVEPHNEFVQRLIVASQESDPAAPVDMQMGSGAACVVLEAANEASARGARIYGAISGYSYVPPGTSPEGACRQFLAGAAVNPQLLLTPNQQWPAARTIVERLLPSWEDRPPELLDLCTALDDLYGALGVFQCVAACLWLQRQAAANRSSSVLAISGASWKDGVASLVISSFGLQLKESGRPARRWPVCTERAIDGQTLQVYQWPDTPSQAPAIAMIHGLEEGSDIWLGLCQALADQFRPFGLELPWHGRDGYRWGHVRPATEWLDQALDLMPVSPAILVAHSFGANTVLEYLQYHTLPGLRAVVLVAPFYQPRYEGFDWAFFRQSTEKFGEILKYGLQVRKGGKEIEPALLEAMTEKVLDRVGPLGFMEFFSVFSRTPALRLDRIHVPVLVVSGADDPAAAPNGASLAERLPDGHLALIPECGHFCMIEQPEAFEQTIRRFLSKRLGGTGEEPLT